jgi:hypothetical protein
VPAHGVRVLLLLPTGWETLCGSQSNSGYSVNGSFGDYALADPNYVGRLPSSLEWGNVPFPRSRIVRAGTVTDAQQVGFPATHTLYQGDSMSTDSSKKSTGAKPAVPPRVGKRSIAGKRPVSPSGALPSADRCTWIAEAAYFNAERRGFAPGGDWQDWFEAERDLDAMSETAGSGSVER